MKEETMNIFQRCVDNIPPEINLEIDLLYDLSDRMSSIMGTNNISIEDIVNKLDIPIEEVCGILSSSEFIKNMKIFKVLFLDIDGVLNSDDYFNNREDSDNRPYPLSEFDPKAVIKINKVLEKCDLLVISSDWRFQTNLKNILIEVGIDKNKVNSAILTPFLGQVFKDNVRGHEIDFVIKNLKRFYKKVNYVIIDDLLTFMPFQKVHLVHTSFKTGITDNDVNKAIEILENTRLYV